MFTTKNNFKYLAFETSYESDRYWTKTTKICSSNGNSVLHLNQIGPEIFKNESI
jgi:hypothetical protein